MENDMTFGIVMLQVTSFDNCTCIADRIMNDHLHNFTVSSGTAVDMKCEQQCNKLGVFLAVIFLAILLIFILEVPNVIITVRQEFLI